MTAKAENLSLCLEEKRTFVFLSPVSSPTQCRVRFLFVLVIDTQLPYDETSTTAATVLDNLTNDEDVADLRDTYEADLVQLAANLGFSCGRG